MFHVRKLYKSELVSDHWGKEENDYCQQTAVDVDDITFLFSGRPWETVPRHSHMAETQKLLLMIICTVF